MMAQNDQQHQGAQQVQQLLHNFLQNFLGPKAAAIGATSQLPTGLAAALPRLLFPPLAKSGIAFPPPPLFPFGGQQEQNQVRIFGLEMFMAFAIHCSQVGHRC